MKRCVYACLLVAVLASWPAAGDEPASEGLRAITRPSKEFSMSFEVSGKVQEILVKDSDRIKPEQVLVKLDDTVEQIRVKSLKANAENETRIKAAAAKLAQSGVELKRLEDLGRQNVATDWEIEQARLDKLIAALSVDLAKFEQEQAQFEYEQARASLERMRLESPIDGVIEKVEVEVGESVDRLQPVLQVVKLDPLWVEVPVPEAQAKTVAMGQNSTVHFDDGSQLFGTVTHKSSVGDAASRTLMIRVEVANPNQRRAGEHVQVTFGRAPNPPATSSRKASSPRVETGAGAENSVSVHINTSESSQPRDSQTGVQIDGRTDDPGK